VSREKEFAAMVYNSAPIKSRLAKVVVALTVIVALGVASAGAAQAATANWTVNGSPLKAGTSETVRIAKTNEAFSLKEASGIEEKCQTLNGSGTLNGGGTGSFSNLTFSGCSYSSAPAACRLRSSAKVPYGTLALNPVATQLKAKLVASEYSFYEVLTSTVKDPEGKLTFMTMEISAEPGKSCPFSGNYDITGTMGFELSKVPAVELLTTASEKTATESGTAMKFGTSTMTITGKFGEGASGVNVGKPVGVVAES
jgi:hypothetical protein